MTSIDDRALKIYERALHLLEQGHDQASVEQQEWLAYHQAEARFQQVMQRSAPKLELVYKRKDDAMVTEPELPQLPDIFTEDQIEAVGQALSEIRRQMREEAQWKFDRLKREVGQLRAELAVMQKIHAEWKREHDQR